MKTAGAILVFLAAIVSADELPDAPGKATVERICGACHGFGVFSQTRMNRQEWGFIIDEMVERGAKINRSDRRTILDYLAKNLGTPAKPPQGKK
jgi:cytochrome c5